MLPSVADTVGILDDWRDPLLMTTTNDATIVALLRRVGPHLSRRRKGQFLLLFLLMMISAFADVVSLGAVLPFIAVLTSPEKVLDFPIVADVADVLGITDPRDLVLPLTIAFASAALVSGAIRILILWFNLRLSVAVDSDLSLEGFRRTLFQPYSLHVERNSSELISAITSKISAIVGELLRPLVMVAGSMVIITSIAATLLVIDATVAVSVAIVVGVSYSVTAWVVRKRLRENGQVIAREHPYALKAVQEGLGGIRDVLLDGTQDVYCDIYRRSDRPMRRAKGANSFLNSSPRMILEAIGVAALAALTYTFSHREGGVGEMLPVIGAVVFAAQRLIPAAHQTYSSWASLVGGRANVSDALALLEQPIPEGLQGPQPDPLPFKDTILVEGLRFRYSNDGPWVIDGVDLKIRRGEHIGLVGGSGSGKSTLLDLLMGLLEPDGGLIAVDGQPIHDGTTRAWQRNIAHVPQFIFLADVSIADNIALGLSREETDRDHLVGVSECAQIATFIESLSEGYATLIGERGVRLSGGQRQRLGLARALYKETDLLILDEATSALDNETERAVTAAVARRSDDLTVVTVAHRLSTIRHCDRIYELVDGRVESSGTYDEMLLSSPSFRRMAEGDDMPRDVDVDVDVVPS